MSNKTAEIQAMIAGAMSLPKNQRTRALKACQWRLRGPRGEYVGLGEGVRCAFVAEDSAVVFDGRDNEKVKLETYERELGPLAIEVLPCAS